MLWEKDNNGVYTDLLKNIEYTRQSYRLNRKKSNNFSVIVRNEGNKKYAQNDFEGALSKYNESICLAENSEHLCLAYANRSQCFLKLLMYDRCLKDVVLAKEAGYPINLLSKLECRQSECMKHLQQMHEVFAIRSQPTLIIEPHEKLPQLASVLDIDSDSLYGRLVKANTDIKIGETLLIEKSYVRTVNDDESNECTNCGKRNANFIPCKNCADAMYCDKDCAENCFHKYECDIVFGTIENNDWLAYILRSLIIGLSNFDSLHEMILFVESCLSTSPSEITVPCISCKDQYRTFLKLTSSVSDPKKSNSVKIAYFTYHAIMSSTKLVNKFRTTAERHFLVHLIMHHHFVLRKNSFGYVKGTAQVHELSLISSYFNHSCLPNIAKLSMGNISVCKSILPIKCNDQLFVTYIADEVFDMTEKQRNDQLEECFEFRCRCRLCEYGTLQAHSLESDPSFMSVVADIKRNIFDASIIQRIIRYCIQFLVEHSHMLGSQELHYIADILTSMYSKELNE